MIKTSYSKAQAFKTCKRKYKYAHYDMYAPDSVKKGLMPLEKSKALALGSHGHAVLEHYLKALKEKAFPYMGPDVAEAAQSALMWGLVDNPAFTMEIQAQLNHFMLNVFPQKGWRIVEVEREYALPVGTTSTGEKKVYPFTVDLIVEIGGQLVVVDHKFAADAYNDKRLAIEPQLPMYIGALRALNVNIAYGMYNFMRTRKMNEVTEQVVQAKVDPNMERIKAAFTEHLETMAGIVEYEAKPNKAWPRNANNNCNYCDFKDLCGIELTGEDTTIMRRTRFVANDYGYVEEK